MFTQKDQLKFEIISKLSAGLIDTKLASRALNVSYRTIIRYKKSFLLKGSAFLVHGNTGKKPHNAISAQVKDEILKLLTDKYFDFSILHAWEKIRTQENNIPLVSYKTLINWCHEKKYIRKVKRKKVKIHRARKRMPKTGMILQMDGSYHKWYGDKKSCLIGVIDDANNEISYAEFFDSENTLDCMSVIQKIIEKHGVFDILYTDKAGVYGGNKRQDFCQLEEACKEVGIQVIYAHTAQAKGRIERLWGTLQGRLVPELRLANITTKKQANRFLHETFIPNQYNKKFLVAPLTDETSYRACFRKDLNEIFSKKEYRTIKADQSFSYNSTRYLLDCYPGNLANKMVQIRTYQNREIRFFWADKELSVVEFDKIAA